jgi:hypothetical protein
MPVSSKVDGADKSVWRAVVDTHPEAIAAALQGLADRAAFLTESSHKPFRSGGSFYDAAFAHTMMRGLVAASLGQVAVLSLITVTGVLRGPQYPTTNISFWLHSPRHAAVVQSRRITRMAFSATPGGPGGPSAP